MHANSHVKYNYVNYKNTEKLIAARENERNHSSPNTICSVYATANEHVQC